MMLLGREDKNGIYVERTGAHSDRGTLHRYRRHVGGWIDLPVKANFERKARADIFRIVSYPDRRILFGLRGSLARFATGYLACSAGATCPTSAIQRRL